MAMAAVLDADYKSFTSVLGLQILGSPLYAKKFISAETESSNPSTLSSAITEIRQDA